MSTEISCCPFCSGQLQAGYVWKADARTLIASGKAYNFTRSEAVLFDVLWRASSTGRGVDLTSLMTALYEGDPNGGPASDNIVSVFLCRMRKVLKGSGMNISSRPGVSLYHLIFEKAQAA